MTSAAQLKYLDAIGIPVWVSRELVMKNNIVEGHSVISSTKDDVIASMSPEDSISVITSNATSGNSAQNIINSLEQSHPNKIALNKVIADSVNTAIIPNQFTQISQKEFTEKNIVFKSSRHYVFASGNETADWMIVGHSPEVFNGVGHEPFAGEAGDLLVNMIRAVGIEYPRHEAYFVNVLDINRSQQNSPDKDSMCILNKELTNLIEKVSPKIVLIVGQIAAQNLLEIEDPLIIMRSKIHHLTDKKLPCVVTYYPSYLLQKTIDKRKAWNDLKLAMSKISDVS